MPTPLAACWPPLVSLWVHFYRDERQSTLLEALASGFEYSQGCALRVVLDNMATAVLGRWGPNGQPVWHPRFPLKIL